MKHRILPAVLWTFRLAAAGLFISASVPKLLGQETVMQEFAILGLGQWFRVLTGLTEVAGGILVLLPATSPVGAALLLMVDAGAFAAQATVLHGDLIHTIVIACALTTLIYLPNRAAPARALL